MDEPVTVKKKKKIEFRLYMVVFITIIQNLLSLRCYSLAAENVKEV